MNEQEFHITLKGLVVRGERMMFFKKRGYDNEEYCDLPGGRMKEGESLQEGFVREMKEETGVDVVYGKHCGMHIFENRLLHNQYKLCALFIKTEIDDMDAIVLSDEHCGVEWLTKKEILEHKGYKSSSYLLECKDQLLSAFE